MCIQEHTRGRELGHTGRNTGGFLQTDPDGETPPSWPSSPREEGKGSRLDSGAPGLVQALLPGVASGAAAEAWLRR